MELSLALLDELSTLWGDLESYSADKLTECNLHLMRSLADWLEADYAYWCGLGRVTGDDVPSDDPLGGWRNLINEAHKLPDVYSKHGEELLENQHLAETVGMASIAIMRETGNFRVRLLRELVDLSEYEQSGHFERFHMPYGLSDRVYIVTPITDDTESCYVFELAGDDRRFTAEQVSYVATAIRGARWLQRRVMLSHGLLAGTETLNPMENTIVQLLLTDKSEQDIAEAIDRARSTTHNYITGIYRKLGVNNRAGLMSLWLG